MHWFLLFAVAATAQLADSVAAMTQHVRGRGFLRNVAAEEEAWLFDALHVCSLFERHHHFTSSTMFNEEKSLICWESCLVKGRERVFRLKAESRHDTRREIF